MNIFKNGMKMVGNIIVAAIVSFFLCVSMNIICSAIFTAEIGYKAYVYETETSETVIEEYEYLYTDNDGDGVDDGADTKKKEYEDKGYTVTTVKTRSTLTGLGKAIFLIVTQILSLVMIVAFSSNLVYKQGFKDNNLVRIGHVKKDMLKGFKIGFIGNIPFIALFIFALVTAQNLRPVLYAFLNAHYYSAIMLITNGCQTLSDVGIGGILLMGLLLLVVPAVSGVAYIFGFKGINLAEKIVYEKEVE